MTEKQFQYTKAMFEKSQSENGLRGLAIKEFHEICYELNQIWGNVARTSCDMKKQELGVEIMGIPCYVEYRLGFSYQDNRKNPDFNLQTSEINAGVVIVPAEYVSYKRAIDYKEHGGYYESRTFYDKRNKNVHLIVQNVHDVTEMLMHSDTYEDFIKNLVLEDAKFPFLKDGEQSYQEFVDLHKERNKERDY